MFSKRAKLLNLSVTDPSPLMKSRLKTRVHLAPSSPWYGLQMGYVLVSLPMSVILTVWAPLSRSCPVRAVAALVCAVLDGSLRRRVAPL